MKFETIKENLLKYSDSVIDLGEFYDKCLNEFYEFMPYYTYNYHLSFLPYQDALEVNGIGIEKMSELNKLYTKLYHEKSKN